MVQIIRLLRACELEAFDALDLLCWVQTLRACICAVHNCVAPVELELIVDSIEPLLGILITTVSYPSVSVKQGSRAQIRLRIPPIARAGSATASTENTLIHPIKLLPIRLGLRILLSLHRRRVLPLQPRLNALVLVVEIGHVHHQILHHEHVWQRRDRGGTPRRDLGEASEAITAVDVHRAGPTDPLTARSTEGERWVDLVLDLDQSVENHGSTLFQIDLVVLELRLRGVVWVPTVDREGLQGF